MFINITQTVFRYDKNNSHKLYKFCTNFKAAIIQTGSWPVTNCTIEVTSVSQYHSSQVRG